MSLNPPTLTTTFPLNLTQTGRRQPFTLTPVGCAGVSFSPCMRYVATGSEDNAAVVFDLRSAADVDIQPLYHLRGHRCVRDRSKKRAATLITSTCAHLVLNEHTTV